MDDARDGVSPYEADEAMLADARRHGGTVLHVYRPLRALVLGRGSRVEAEADAEACRAEGVPLLRRRGGGCAVLLDPADLVLSLALPLPGLGRIHETYDLVTTWLISALAQRGLPGVRREGVSDLALLNRKVGGSCLYRERGLAFYTTTLLVDPPLDLMERLLPHPPREPGYRRGRSHRDFLGTLRRPGLVEDAGDLERLLGDLVPPSLPTSEAP